MSLVLQSSGGGQITIQEPATASNFTQTLPAASGVTMVSGNMPAFSAYASATTSLVTSTFTKIAFNIEVFDTNNNFDSTTNYRFTPTVAGYYQLNGGFNFGGYIAAVTIFSIYKNGTEFYRGIVQPNNASSVASVVSGLVFADGSTDYFELYAFQNSGITQTSGNGATGVWFNGSLVRTA